MRQDDFIRLRFEITINLRFYYIAINSVRFFFFFFFKNPKVLLLSSKERDLAGIQRNVDWWHIPEFFLKQIHVSV